MVNNKKSAKVRSIMFVGTGSDVGKIGNQCRILSDFLQDGYSPLHLRRKICRLTALPQQMD